MPQAAIENHAPTGELVVANEVEVIESRALAALNRSEIDMQVATAKRYPRSVHKFKQTAELIATADEETAASMFYNIPRDGKRIEGPSVRLAEVCQYAWGNMRAGARIIDIDQKFVTAQGFAFDLETNTANSLEVRRGITTKDGRRYGDDMIRVTCQAACAIARRDAIFSIIPRVYANQIYRKARQVAVGSAKTLKSRLAAMVEHFGKMGVTEQQVCDTLERRSIDDITLDDLSTLIGLSQAIKDGDITIDEAFGEKEKPSKRGGLKPPKKEQAAPPPGERPADGGSQREPGEAGASAPNAPPSPAPDSKAPTDKRSVTKISQLLETCKTTDAVDALLAEVYADEHYTKPEIEKIDELAEKRRARIKEGMKQ